MGDRINAGILRKPTFHKDFEGPQRALCDGVAGRPINPRGDTAGILDGADGSQRIPPEFGRSQLIDQAMHMAMTTDFVTGASDSTNNLRVAFRHPAEDQESPKNLFTF